MSAVLTPAATTPAPARVPALRVTQGRVLRSELTKFRSLRSTMWTLLAAVVLMIGLGALFSGVTASQYHTFNWAERAAFNPVTTSLNGVIFAVVAFGVLGVLLTGGEYSTGMIRSSLTAVPRRLPVLWGKVAVFAHLAAGLSNREIADQMHLSQGTVKIHVGRILAKLDLRDRVQAVVLAYESGLIKPGSQ
jgi:ABC-2 type transport system permease protein